MNVLVLTHEEFSKKTQLVPHFDLKQLPAKAISEASVSNSNGWNSSKATTTGCSISNFTNSNAFLASVLNGNDLDFTSGLILLENFGIHCA